MERIEIHKGPHLNTLDKYEPEPPPQPPPPPSPTAGEESPNKGGKRGKSKSKSKSPPKEQPPEEPAPPPVYEPPPPPKIRVGPPFRVGVNVFHFQNVQIMQVDVEVPEEEIEPEKPKPKSNSGGSFCLDEPPVDPQELTEALEAAQEGRELPKVIEVPESGDERWGINDPTSFRKGVACVFIAKPEDLIKFMQRSPLRIKVERFDGYEAYEVGRTDVKIPYNFQTSLLKTHKLINEPISNYVEDTFPLLNPVGEPIGEMEVYFSFTCYGGRIQADFLVTEKGLYTLLNNYCQTETCHIPQTRQVNICRFSERK